MPLTPSEIIQRRFRRTLIGYSPKEINAFLSEVGETIAHLLEENSALREERIQLKERLNVYTAIEQQLQDVLAVAERATDEVKRLAHREADLIISQGKQQADQLREEAQQQIRQFMEEIERTGMALRQLLQAYRRPWSDRYQPAPPASSG